MQPNDPPHSTTRSVIRQNKQYILPFCGLTTDEAVEKMAKVGHKAHISSQLILTLGKNS